MSKVNVFINIRNVDQDETGGMFAPLIFSRELEIENMFKLFGDLVKRVNEEN